MAFYLHYYLKGIPTNLIIADNKWFTRVVVVAGTIIQTLDSLDLEYPEVGPDKLKELAVGFN